MVLKTVEKKKSEDGLRDFWDNMKRTDIGIIGLTKWKGVDYLIEEKKSMKTSLT